MHTRPLGSTGPQDSAFGLGCMGMSWLNGDAEEVDLSTVDGVLRLAGRYRPFRFL